MPDKVVEIELPNGATAFAHVNEVQGVGAKKTTSLSKFKFDEVGRTLAGVADSIKDALEKAAPDTVTVELGLELTVKNGVLSGMIAQGQGKGSLVVTLGWGGGSATG